MARTLNLDAFDFSGMTNGEIANFIKVYTRQNQNNSNNGIAVRNNSVDIDEITEPFMLEENKKLSKEKLLNTLASRYNALEKIVEQYEICPEDFDNDTRIEIMTKVCTYFNAMIICAITGLRITKIKEDEKSGIDIPIFGLVWKIEDRVKDIDEANELVGYICEINNLADRFDCTVTSVSEIFEKKEWFNLQRMGRITNFAKYKSELLTKSLISKKSVSELIKARNSAWKEFIIGSLITLLVVLSGSCIIAYNYNDNFKRNVDDLFNYYSDSFSDSDVQNIVGD